MGIGKHLSDAEFEEFNQITYKFLSLYCYAFLWLHFVIFSGIQVVPESLHIIALHHNYFMFMTFTHSAGIFLIAPPFVVNFQSPVTAKHILEFCHSAHL